MDHALSAARVHVEGRSCPVAFDRLTKDGVHDALLSAIPWCATHLRPDFKDALARACKAERAPRARTILSQMLENARIGETSAVPICQDTGTVWVRLEVGESEMVPGDVFCRVDEAVARAYDEAHLRKSVLFDALSDRTNTGSNTPAFCEMAFRPGTGATLTVMLKGGGSDNASRVVMLAPGAGIEGVKAAVLDRVVEKATCACPPLLIGVGVGATFDKVAGLAKHALLRETGMPSSDPTASRLEQELLRAVNATGIGPAGLGGDTTALAVHVDTAPCHIAALPVAIQMGCSSMRSLSMTLVQKGV